MEIREIEKQELDNGVQRVFLEAVLMPSGELIRYGKSLGITEGKGVYIKDE